MNALKNYPQANIQFGPPPELEESQCQRILAFAGTVQQGSVEGSPIIVTAFKPSDAEIKTLMAGGCIYVSFLTGSLPPHMLTTSFEEAINPA